VKEIKYEIKISNEIKAARLDYITAGLLNEISKEKIVTVIYIYKYIIKRHSKTRKIV
jgi:hypothetical protein